MASWRARGFSPVTIDNDIGLLERTLKALGRPAWEVTAEDIDRVVGDLAVAGRATSTRREYVQIFKGFHRFLQARKAAEIEAAFGVRLVCPVDEFNASRHVGDDSPAQLPPPTPERVAEFFELPEDPDRDRPQVRARRPGTTRCSGRCITPGCGRRRRRCWSVPDVHFGRGPFGKLHVRFGKGAHTSGPRPRWVPMLDGLDLVLRWFLDDVRGKFPDSPVLFADESGGALHRGHDPQPAAVPDGAGGPPGRRAVQPACAAPGVRDPQLRARRGPGRDPAAARSLDGRARRCGMSGPRPRSSRTPTGAR